MGLNGTKTARNIERSAAYPAIDLKVALEEVARLSSSLGNGPYSREAASVALGHKGLSGTSSRKIAALVHFGLLERVGNTYKLSDLARRIIFYHSEEDKLNAMIEAVCKPKLYSALIDKFGGTSIPTLLNNILITQFDINKNVAEEVAKDFKESLEFTGLIRNGVVIHEGYIEADENKTSEQIKNNSDIQTDHEAKRKINGDSYSTPSLPSGIVITFPGHLKTAFVLGEFSNEIKSIEMKAQSLAEKQKEEIG